MPPILCTSSMTYLPDGLRSATNGIRSLTAWKSSMPSLTPHECAMAIRCRTALVEPPRIMVRTMAFSNAARVMMSRGRMLFSRRRRMAGPTASHSSCFSLYAAGVDDE